MPRNKVLLVEDDRGIRFGIRNFLVGRDYDVEEAVHMADRVAVLSPRPSHVKTMFTVDLPRPRAVASYEVQALRGAILRELGVEQA